MWTPGYSIIIPDIVLSYLIGGVRSNREQAEQRSPVVCLGDHPLQVKDDVLEKRGSEGVMDILPRLGKEIYKGESRANNPTIV